MEVLFTIFRIISSFSLDTLYEISLVNNLFNFDLNNKIVILKEKKTVKKIHFIKDEAQTYISTNPSKNISQNSFLSDDINIGSEKRFNEDIYNNKVDQVNFLNINTKKKYSKDSRNESINTIIFSPKVENINKSNDLDKKDRLFYINNRKENQQKKRNIINKIKINKCCIYLCFCLTRKRKIIQNILLDEGMNIISEKIDIFNIFEKMYKLDKIKIINKKIFEMSDESKIKLKSIDNNLS